MKKQAKLYQAWARVKHTNHQFVTTVIKAYSITDATAIYERLNLEIQNKPYLSPYQRG